MKRVGIYGGTFDPVHNGHLRVADLAVKQLNLDKLIIIPAGIPPHKPDEMISDNFHRLKMCELAFCGEKFEVSDYEIKKGGKSYTYQTVEHFKNEGEELFLIIGGDSLYNLHTWKNPQAILNLAHVFAVGRLDEGKMTNFIKGNMDRITICDIPTGEESSTEIRVLTQFGEDISSFVPPVIEKYVKENALYSNFSSIAKKVKERLKISRYNHTIGVVLTATKLNQQAHVLEEKAFIAALLHDVAKYEGEDCINKYEELLKKEGINLPKPVIHAFLGSYIAKDEFNITDEEILSAIKYHCTAKPNMSNLEKLIYLSDGIERGRDYPGVDKIREITKLDFEKGFVALLNHVYEYVKEKDTCPLTKQAVEYYLK
ncbi:MAG: nicotinate-nucleotide adenylyltransferase [Clostridia bacterium]|nr:nicotinate-nucleotide adenylyltransferase [Clostridia bacterium]